MTTNDAKSANPPETPTPPVEHQGLLDAYRQVLMCIFIATMLLIVVLAATLLFLPNPTILPFVALSGALGAFFSSLMRLYNFEDLPKALIGEGLGLHDLYLVAECVGPAGARARCSRCAFRAGDSPAPACRSW